MKIFYFITFLLLLLLSVNATEKGEFEIIINKMADQNFKVRKKAKSEVIELFDKEPKILEAVTKVYFDPKQEDIELKANCLEVMEEIVRTKLFQEKGTLGIKMESDLTISEVFGEPAVKAGLQVGWKIKSINGKDCQGQQVAFVANEINICKPGSELTMILIKENKEEITVKAITAPRSKIWNDEDIEKSRSEFYENWLEEMKKKYSTNK